MDEVQRQLVALQNASAKARGKLLKELAARGYRVEFSNLVYTVVDAQGERHRLPRQLCPQCRETKLLSEFFGVKNALPWCKACRERDPRGAKLAADRFYQRGYPIEKRREKEQRQKEKHPQRKERSDMQLQALARDLACTILREQAQEYIDAQESLYAPVQRRKILGYIEEIVQDILKYPAHMQRIEQIAATLREESQRLLD